MSRRLRALGRSHLLDQHQKSASRFDVLSAHQAHPRIPARRTRDRRDGRSIYLLRGVHRFSRYRLVRRTVSIERTVTLGRYTCRVSVDEASATVTPRDAGGKIVADGIGATVGAAQDNACEAATHGEARAVLRRAVLPDPRAPRRRQ